MRTYSTPQSALNGEITKLAIIECIASVTLYVGLGVYFGTFKYLAVAIVFAPLMLFRTEVSADWGLRLYSKVNTLLVRAFDKPDKPSGDGESLRAHRPSSVDESLSGALRELGGVFWLLGSQLRLWAFTSLRFATVLTLTTLIGVAIRVIATVYWAFRRPLNTLREAPQNWLRQALCVDFAHPPEIVPKEALTPVIVPEEALTGAPVAVPTFARSIQGFRYAKGPLLKLTVILYTMPLFIIGYIPSTIYRIAFKATAMSYVPFIWVAHATLRNPFPIKARLERFTKGELEKVRRGVSYLVLTTLAAKGALVFNWVDRGKVEAMFPSQKVVTDIVVLDAWPWWQITLGTDALLTFALLYFADAALSRIEAQRPWREESVMTAVATISFLRASFALVTIAHFFHVALLVAAPEWARHLLTF